MTRLRGRPVRPMPVHPERIISRAVKAGLSATIELQRNISNKATKKYYERSRERFVIRQQVYQLTKERGKPDFSYISMAEAPTRTDARQMFYEQAVKYGFTEVNRQKNSNDTVDPLNQRLNACGAIVRENSEVDFQFSTPVDFGTYTRRDGKGIKKYRRAGYNGSSFGPKVILAHPDLPSLDFGDAVRTHNEYLATFCAIHNVPVKETTRYCQLFYLLVRPYLEYLYSESECGKKNFQKGVNWALRQIKELIRRDGYLPTMCEKRTVTKELEFDDDRDKIQQENETLFKRIEEEAREFYGDHVAVKELSRLRGDLGDDKEEKREVDDSKRDDDDNIFTVNDVDYIRNEVAKRARVAGSIMHRRISDMFLSPWHIKDVIISGDRYARHSDYIIISEVPIRTAHGLGKIDLILCKRTISDDGKHAFWEPVFALEIKTRLGQSLYIDANYKESEVRPEGSSLQRVVSNFPLSDHPLSEDMWDMIVNSTPTLSARKQLDIYCQALSESYKEATQQELRHILRGVVIIESSSDISKIRGILEPLIIKGYESVKHKVHKVRRTFFTPDKCDNGRIALVIDSQPSQNLQDVEKTKVPWNPTYTPFKTKKKSKREFILYLAGHSPTSAGQSAAWNARYYHGLQMLYEIKKKHENAEFHWIDLASQFNEPHLAEARLRLRPRGYAEEELAKVHADHTRLFFEEIKVQGYLDESFTFLFNDGGLPSFILDTKQKRQVIVVTGVDTIRNATPMSYQDRFSLLIDHLLSSLPDDEKTMVVWFDSPVPSIEKSVSYSTRALLPFYETSPLGDMVTEIIWNLPVASRSAVQPERWGLSTIGDAPMHDDIRVIVRHSPTDISIKLAHVPFLRGWSKRFRNKGSGKIIREQELDDIVPEKTVRDRLKLLSLTIIPWLVQLWPQERLVEGYPETLEEQITLLGKQHHGGDEPLDITSTILPSSPCRPPSVLDLVRFRLPKTIDASSYQEMTIGKINSQRLYRSPHKLQTQPLQTIPQPLSTREVQAVDSREELDQEWLFGVKFESENDDIQSWWMVVQDPDHPSRLLAGCFTDRPPDKDGFLWAENRREVLTQQTLDEILGIPQTILIGRKNEKGMETWSTLDGEATLFAGTLELRGQGRSTTGHLRAVRQTVTEEPAKSPSLSIRPSESFYKRALETLRRYFTSISSPTPVSVHLEMMDDLCHVVLRDTEDNEVQDIPVEYTADLIALLRWPTVKEGPMFTDSGEYVTWSIFDDIDYGELDFIRPYVTYTAARKTPVELPKRVSQFFDEVKSLSVSLSHDASVCPIVSGTGMDHEACWRIELPSNCPTRVRKQLDRPLTGEEVNGLLAPGRLFTGRLYTFEFTPPIVSEKDESIVFHEERYIRMFFRSKGLRFKKLPPGTFLHVPDQEWIISIGWDGRHFKWQAESTVSSLSFKGHNQTVELVHGRSAQEECNRLLNIITSQIPPAQIHEYSELEEHIIMGLKDRGYSKNSPACELRVIEQSDEVFRYGIFLTENSQRTPLESFGIEAGEGCIDAIMEEITTGLTEGDASAYNIRNVEHFMEHLFFWVLEHIQEVEWDAEEPVEYEVTLTLDDGMQSILWKAEVSGSEEHKRGAIYYDPRALPGVGIREAIREMQEIFEREVVGELGEVSNLDDVMKQQIPEMIRSLLERK